MFFDWAGVWRFLGLACPCFFFFAGNGELGIGSDFGVSHGEDLGWRLLGWTVHWARMIPFLWIVGIADWLGLGPKGGWLRTGL